MIKFLNINKQDKPIKKKIFKNITKVINKNDFILGDYVEKFEKNFGDFCGTKYAISCANGTDALTIALKVLNLPKNSKVIIPAMTYCSTAFAVLNGATVVEKHFTIDKDLPGRDNKFALDSNEFNEMCKNIHIASNSIIDKGNGYQSIEEDTVMNYRGRWEPQDYS